MQASGLFSILVSTFLAGCGGDDGHEADADTDVDADTDADSDSDSDSDSDTALETGCGGDRTLELQLVSHAAGTRSEESPPLANAIVIVDCAAGRTEGTTDAEGLVRFMGLDYANDPPDVTFWAEGHTIETMFDVGGNGRFVAPSVRWTMNRFEGALVLVEVPLTRSLPGSGVAASSYWARDATREATSSFFYQESADPFRYVGIEYEVVDDLTKRLVSFTDTTIVPGGDAPTLTFPADYGGMVRFDVSATYAFDPAGPLGVLAPRTSEDGGAFRGAVVEGGSADAPYQGVFGLTESSATDETGETFHVAYADEVDFPYVAVVAISGRPGVVAFSTAGVSLPLDGTEEIVLEDAPTLDVDQAVTIDVTSEPLTLLGAEWASVRFVSARAADDVLWRVFASPDSATVSFPAPPTGHDWSDALPSFGTFDVRTEAREWNGDPWGPDGYFGEAFDLTIRRSARDESWRGALP